MFFIKNIHSVAQGSCNISSPHSSLPNCAGELIGISKEYFETCGAGLAQSL